MIHSCISCVSHPLCVLSAADSSDIVQSTLLREQRIEMMQNLVEHQDALPFRQFKEVAVADQPTADERLSEYLQVVEKGKGTDEAVSSSPLSFPRDSELRVLYRLRK